MDTTDRSLIGITFIIMGVILITLGFASDRTRDNVHDLEHRVMILEERAK